MLNTAYLYASLLVVDVFAFALGAILTFRCPVFLSFNADNIDSGSTCLACIGTFGNLMTFASAFVFFFLGFSCCLVLGPWPSCEFPGAVFFSAVFAEPVVFVCLVFSICSNVPFYMPQTIAGGWCIHLCFYYSQPSRPIRGALVTNKLAIVWMVCVEQQYKVKSMTRQ